MMIKNPKKTKMKKMKKIIPIFLVLILSLGFTAPTQAQVKYGGIAYQYYKNSKGQRIVKYDVRRLIYNTAAEAKAAIDIRKKADETKDGEIFFSPMSLDVTAALASKTSYEGTFTTKVRNKEGAERSVNDERYCIFRTEIDFMENVISMLQNYDDIIEPIVFYPKACKS